MYEWASNKQKLQRSIDFVRNGTSGTAMSKEQTQQMVKEYYVQLGGLMLREPTDNASRVPVVSTPEPVSVESTQSTLSQEQVDTIKRKKKKHEKVVTDAEPGDGLGAQEPKD